MIKTLLCVIVDNICVFDVMDPIGKKFGKFQEENIMAIKQERKTCFENNHSTFCNKLGDNNRFGNKKAFCCIHYQNKKHQKKFNPFFDFADYCSYCQGQQV